MQQVIIHNINASPMVVTKDHKLWCDAVGKCDCASIRTTTFDYVQDKGSKELGERMPRPINRLVADSFTIWGNSKSEPLPEAVLQLPEIAGAIAQRRVRIMKL